MKAGVVAFVVLAVTARRTEALSSTAVVVGATLGLLLEDLRAPDAR